MREDLALTHLIEQALEAAKRVECATAVDIVMYLAERATEPEMYRVCKAFAEAGMQAAILYHGGRTPDRDAGELWTVPADPTGDPARLWAGRFLAAHGNADSTMTRALFGATWENGTVLESTCALVAVTAAIIDTAQAVAR